MVARVLLALQVQVCDSEVDVTLLERRKSSCSFFFFQVISQTSLRVSRVDVISTLRNELFKDMTRTKPFQRVRDA